MQTGEGGAYTTCPLLAPRLPITLLTMVIRDYKRCRDRPGTQQPEQVKNNLRVEMEKFMDSKPNTLGDEAGTAKISNVLTIKALDSAMRLGVGRSVKDFQLETLLTPLGEKDKLYLVKDEDLDEDNRREGVSQRACIVNEGTDQTRYALPAETVEQDALFLFSDQGSVGWVGWIFMYSVLGIFGFFHWDICHYWWNGYCNAMKQSGNWFFILELIIVLNLCSGPWAGAAWFHTISQGIYFHVWHMAGGQG